MSSAISHIINSRISEMNLTNNEIASKINCTEGTVRNIRRGDLGSRSFEVISALCNLLDIPIEMLAEVERSNMFSKEDLSFLMSFRNADSRAQADVLLILNAHQKSIPANSDIYEKSLESLSKAQQQNGSHSSEEKEIAP